MNEEIKAEFKTIRITAQTYYKLVELTGMLNTMSGYNFSLTQTADMMISGCHGIWYPEYLKIMNNPKAMQKARDALQQNIKNAFELNKNVKIMK